MERENPFKKLGYPPKEVPKELKGKVMEDVALLKFIMDSASLFSTNYSHAIESFFKKRKKHKKDSNNH
tara:strand:+ start:119 stop:322 length:204 start_codon:yes stop_codon:yes gene_type:complete